MLSTAFLTHPEAYDQVDRQECVRVDLGTGVTQKLSTDFIRVVHQTSRNAVGRLKPAQEFKSLHLRQGLWKHLLPEPFLYRNGIEPYTTDVIHIIYITRTKRGPHPQGLDYCSVTNGGIPLT